MERNLYFVGPLMVVIALALACGGGGNGEERPTAGPEASPTTEATATLGGTPAPRPTIAVTVPPGARLALIPRDIEAFIQRFAEENPTTADCVYDEESGLVDCTDADAGKFQLAPPVAGTGVDCEAVILGQEPLGVICTSTEPAFAAVYEVAE